MQIWKNIFTELQKVGNRGYTTGFALGDNNGDSYSYDISKGLAGADFLCEFKGEKRDDYFLVKIKNKILLNDEVEIITPKEQFRAVVENIKSEDGEEQELGNTNDDVYIKFSQSPNDYKYALVRTVGVKEYANQA
jgi:putative protease